jgi:hypothetical protein
MIRNQKIKSLLPSNLFLSPCSCNSFLRVASVSDDACGRAAENKPYHLSAFVLLADLLSHLFQNETKWQTRVHTDLCWDARRWNVKFLAIQDAEITSRIVFIIGVISRLRNRWYSNYEHENWSLSSDTNDSSNSPEIASNQEYFAMQSEFCMANTVLTANR